MGEMQIGKELGIKPNPLRNAFLRWPRKVQHWPKRLLYKDILRKVYLCLALRRAFGYMHAEHRKYCFLSAINYFRFEHLKRNAPVGQYRLQYPAIEGKVRLGLTRKPGLRQYCLGMCQTTQIPFPFARFGWCCSRLLFNRNSVGNASPPLYKI